MTSAYIGRKVAPGGVQKEGVHVFALLCLHGGGLKLKISLCLIVRVVESQLTAFWVEQFLNSRFMSPMKSSTQV